MIMHSSAFKQNKIPQLYTVPCRATIWEKNACCNKEQRKKNVQGKTYSSNINAVSSRVSWTACKLMICCESLHSISTAISWLISLLRHWSRRRRRKNLAAYLIPVFLCTTRLTVPNLPLEYRKERIWSFHFRIKWRLWLIQIEITERDRIFDDFGSFVVCCCLWKISSVNVLI